MNHSRKRAKSGVRSAARIFSGNPANGSGARNQGGLMDGPLNISSNPQMLTAEQRKNLMSAANHGRSASLNDPLLPNGGPAENNADNA